MSKTLLRGLFVAFVLLFVTLASSSPLALAQEADPSNWAPPVPDDDAFDWMKMANGEWIKGEIDEMNRGELRFDSDEFDMTTVDFDDVGELRSARTITVLLDDDRVYAGTFHLVGETVRMSTAEGDVEFSRELINSLVPGDATSGGIWSGELTYGLTARSGNSDQLESTLYAEVSRSTAATRFKTELTSNFGKTGGTETTQNLRVFGYDDYYWTSRLYWRVVQLEFYEDRFQNIEQRWTPGTGVGYSIFDDGDLQWSVTASGAYQYTVFRDTQAGEPKTRDDAVVGLATEFEKDLTSDIEFALNYAITVPVADTHGTIHHLRVSFETEVSRYFDFDVSFYWDRVGSPEPDGNGVRPEPDDYRVVVGISADF